MNDTNLELFKKEIEKQYCIEQNMNQSNASFISIAVEIKNNLDLAIEIASKLYETVEIFKNLFNSIKEVVEYVKTTFGKNKEEEKALHYNPCMSVCCRF